ncbi:MAG: T9SS type A sorting domain-containing protein [Bacteroidetes bacterium]|nr:T9SS type A sorting domain-containing protein [Bacteroidota bacterium]
MKTKTKIIASLALTAMSYTTINAQATVKWRTNMQESPFSYFDPSSDEVTTGFTNGVLDTLSNQLYRFSHLDEMEQPQTIDYNPGVAKAIKKGIVIASYNAANGAYVWANELKLISSSGFVYLDQVIPIGNQKGLYAVGRFIGKMTYGTSTFNSKNTAPTPEQESVANDIFIFKIEGTGKLLKAAFIKPTTATPGNYSYVAGLGVDVNGSPVVAFNNETYSSSTQSYDLNPGVVSQNVQFKEGDVAIVKLDANLNYISHNKIEGNGNTVVVRNLVMDAGKNVVINAIYHKGNTAAKADLDAKQAGVQSITIPTGNTEPYNTVLLKYQPNLQLAWSKMFNVGFECNTLVDKLGNIYLGGLLGSYESTLKITFAPNAQVIASSTKATIFLAKFDKMGNSKSLFTDLRPSISSANGNDFYIDSKNNIYFAGNDVKDLYIIKLRSNPQTHAFTQVWKNRIKATSAAVGYVAAPLIIAHKNNVYVTGIYTIGTFKYLVNAPTSTFKVTKNYSDVTLCYSLSGSALSPEEQADENYSNKYKTVSSEVSSLGVAVYPNPATEDLTVKTTLTESAVITIYNYNGIAVRTIAVTEAETKLNISELPAGMYFVEVISNETKEIKKLIKN